MNYNVLAYFLYLLISCFITVYVGWFCYKNGFVHLKKAFGKELALAKTVNKFLLIAYYLLNIGYVVITLKNWVEIESFSHLLGELAFHVGLISLLLGTLHYFNMWVTSKYGERLIAKGVH